MPISVFGLTGGIGSGKSAVAARLRARGVPIVNADELAREAVEPGSKALADVQREFGDSVVGSDGELDRARMASIVFGDTEALKRLEAIIHPEVRRLAAMRFTALDAQGAALGGYEVPLLFEGGLERTYRPVVVVTADVPTRIERTMRRDGWSREQIEARMQAQLPLEDKVQRADFVIDNNGDLASTHRETDRVLDALCTRLGLSPASYPAPKTA